jgi:hypothetical protein
MNSHFALIYIYITFLSLDTCTYIACILYLHIHLLIREIELLNQLNLFFFLSKKVFEDSTCISICAINIEKFDPFFSNGIVFFIFIHFAYTHTQSISMAPLNETKYVRTDYRLDFDVYIH